jgi:hypothetical protein
MMMQRILCLLSVLVLGTACGYQRPPSDDDDDDGSGALVKGLDIESITFNQGVEITLMEDGEEVESRNAPIVEGRDGILRVYLDRQSDFEERDIRVVLDIEEGGSPDPVVLNVDEDSKARKLSSTANFYLDELPSDLNFSVRLEETEAGVEAEGDSNESQWPAEGYEDLNPRDPRGPLKIVLVPVRYNADNSGRMPETSDEQIEIFRNTILQRYPVAEVEISVGATLAWSSAVQPNGAGWSELLDAVLNRRWNESPGRDVYYYGVFSPALSIANYCSQGCVAGLSPLTESAEDDWGRASIGLGFPGEGSANTMVHEVGHAHGREHAPCGLFGQPSDNNYPHNDASIGVWGYDILAQSLRDPDDFTDFMAYCEPAWVSDYTYDELFDRVRAVNNLNHSITGPQNIHQWLVLGLDGHGNARRSGTIQRTVPPGGEEQEIVLLDKLGISIGESTGYFSPLNHLAGGHLLLPHPRRDVRAVQLQDGTIVPLQ